jgi:chemotaxis protein CheD
VRRVTAPIGDPPCGDALAERRRLIVGVGDLAVSNSPDDLIVTHALGSCVAVCVFDPIARVAALLHFMLPDSNINEERGRERPATFADTGIPLLFQTAYRFGLEKPRAVVKLVGGAEIAGIGQEFFKTGRRNALAAKQVLWRNGVLVNAEDTGSNVARTVHFTVHDGRVRIFSASGTIREI